jgi:DNA polymerase delta subunit 3
MLFDFYTQETSKKAGSIHATYLITGYQNLDSMPKVVSQDEDTPMPSSPYMSSPVVKAEIPEQIVKQKVITLAKEEHLDCKLQGLPSIICAHFVSCQGKV